MITLGNTLKVEDIIIDLPSASMSDATRDLMNLLRHDKRITDWAQFVDGVGSADICVAGVLDTNFCIPHSRSRAVRNLIIAAGRARSGLPMSEKSTSDRCHYVFLIGIPSAMDGEYLRLIGSLARIFHNETAVEQLNAAETAEKFHAAVVAAERSF